MWSTVMPEWGTNPAVDYFSHALNIHGIPPLLGSLASLCRGWRNVWNRIQHITRFLSLPFTMCYGMTFFSKCFPCAQNCGNLWLGRWFKFFVVRHFLDKQTENLSELEREKNPKLKLRNFYMRALVLLWSNWKVNFKFKLPGIFETEIFFFHKLVVLLVTSVPNFTSKYSLVFELRFFLWGIKI